MKQLRCILICHAGGIEQEYDAHLASETGEIETDLVLDLTEANSFTVRFSVFGSPMEVPAVMLPAGNGIKVHEDYYHNQGFTDKVLGKPASVPKPMRMA